MAKFLKWPLLSIAALAVVVSGWLYLSREGAYETPESLCGIATDPVLTGAVLPAGGEIEVRNPKVNSSADMLCRIDIDGKAALAIDVFSFEYVAQSLREWYDAAPSTFGFRVEEEVSVAGDEALLGSNGSLTRANCPGVGPEAVLEINIWRHDTVQASEEGRRAMEDFTAAFMASAKDTYGC
ncbi:hypothetical protein ACWGIB_16140 [Streptomyces xiamenensis]